MQLKKLLRGYPFLLYIPLWMLWIFFNFTGSGAWIGSTVLKQLISGPTAELNIIFPITWMSAIVSFLITIFFLKRRTALVNSLLISGASQFGAAFLFEFVFSIIAFYMHGHPILQGNTFYCFIGFIWLIMPICGIGFWSCNNYLLFSIGFFVFGFLVWILIGFPILSDFPSLILNYVTKIASFAIITSLYIQK